ncbi:hypothetical protein B296_00018357 [Ensete ventricosum]|uniref:Uncharacterized protein n=1 Tax=Ensete ventricosum TaxID=4639 RepID=A0A426YX53_ENSVE|nr:hypothetical protein B296_00018357 [Ensete ventricosum]
MQWDLARRFVEGIRKLAGNTPGDCWKKTVRLVTRMPEATGLGGIDQRISQHQVQVRIRKVEGTTFPEIPTVEPPESDGCTTTA